MSDLAEVIGRIDYPDEEDTKILISSLLEGEDRGFSDGEILAWVKRWHRAITEVVLLGLLLKGEITVRWSAEADNYTYSKRT